jgi:hypothetical protein
LESAIPAHGRDLSWPCVDMRGHDRPPRAQPLRNLLPPPGVPVASLDSGPSAPPPAAPPAFARRTFTSSALSPCKEKAPAMAAGGLVEGANGTALHSWLPPSRTGRLRALTCQARVYQHNPQMFTAALISHSACKLADQAHG